jgi:hypothetical protein
MSAADMREHRVPCVRGELKKLIGTPFQLSPKDPDPYPDFYIPVLRDDDTVVEFHKGSNRDVVTIDLRKIAEITTTNEGKPMTYIRVLGRIVWQDDIKRWRFAPTGEVGRPAKPSGIRA